MMTQGKNKLLCKLMMLGVASVTALGHAPAFATTGQNSVIPSVEEQNVITKIYSLAAFLRSYPDSPLAAQITAELKALFLSLPADLQARVALEITQKGGLPATVAAALGLPASPLGALKVPQEPGANSIY
jgi:hypothetical protein